MNCVFVSFVFIFIFFGISDQTNQKQFLNKIVFKPKFLNSTLTIYDNGFFEVSKSCKSINVFKFKNKIYFSELNYSDLTSIYQLSLYSNKIKHVKRYFMAKSGLKITWVNKISKIAKFNKFEIIILTNGFEFYVILQYEELDSIADAIIGYKNDSCFETRFFKNTSSSLLLKNSNINFSGVWIFQIEDLFNSGFKIKNNLFLKFYLLKIVIMNFL